ncbi:unnamed protein product [Microthlaspi erraticum]|uniref:Uncharacterized protein n=1 Tax=Microthlaspi erraticum TaxID=1685480 RepID=A0A6D2HPI3_9BRAS|nr:unnamed protein product [Microthlaspi erraticum]
MMSSMLCPLMINDKLLTNAVRRYKGKNWKKIAECVPGRKDKRDYVQCNHRWLKVLNPNLNKGPWKKEEDDLLTQLVNVYPENDKPKWSKISKQLPGRIGKQCRERWHNHLNPTIKKTPWTREEEVILVQAQRGQGNKWAEIAKLLPGRSENNIKNHWNCSLKKRLEEFLSSPLCGSESSFANQSNFIISESYQSVQIKEDAKSPQRGLTLGPMNWMNTVEEEETMSVSVESDWSRRSSKAEISHWTPCTSDYDMNLRVIPQLTIPLSVKVLESPQTPQSSNDSVCAQELKEIRERLRMAASTFKNTPSIISKSSSPASGLKRRRQEDDSRFLTNAPSEEEHSVSNSPCSKSRFVKLNTCSGSNPLERRLEFDFL